MNKVEICGVNTAKLPVLSGAKMKDLLQRLQAGEESCREQLIHGNLRLVLSVIQRFNNRGECVDDLFQVGCIGATITRFGSAVPCGILPIKLCRCVTA